MDDEPAIEVKSEPYEASRDSHVRLEFSLAIQYQRRRANIQDRWEARFSTIGLLLVGAAVTIIVVLVLIPRFLSLIP